jgi:hypothetical protein
MDMLHSVKKIIIELSVTGASLIQLKRRPIV